MTDTDYQLDLELIKKKAISGEDTFTLRTFFIQSFTFFVYFSDIGLAAALIQKEEQPSRKDLVTTFTIQQVIIFTLIIIGLALSSKIAIFYKLDSQGLMLLRVLIFSLVLSSLKTIPSIILERKLDFTRLVIPQIFENITFYAVAVLLAFKGFGVASFTWAVLARGIIGLILIYFVSPWRPSVGFDKESAKRLTSFGIPF